MPATDPDVGQTLSYSIVGGADASKFTIGSTTGALSFVTAPNFELPTDAGGNNVYDVSVQVSDGNGGIDTQAIAVTVTDVFENTAPIITSNGGGNTAAVSIAENTTAVTTVTATDPDIGQTRSYSIIGGADASKFTIGSSTGALSFIVAPNFEAPTDAGGNNIYDLTVRVSDGNGGIDTQAIAVAVTNVNELVGDAGNDTLDGGAGSDTLAGGPGADTFVFGAAAFADGQAGIFDRITDYNQGNTPTFNSAEGDVLDVSAIVGTAHSSGQATASLVRVLSNAASGPAQLQVDPDGLANGANWITIATLDGIHTGQRVSVMSGPDANTAIFTLSVKDPAAVDISPAAKNDFNGDHESDILLRDTGTGAVRADIIEGAHFDVSATVGQLGLEWQVVGTGDFDRDRDADILWRNVNTGALRADLLQLRADLIQNGQYQSTANVGQLGLEWKVSNTGDYDHDGDADILWQNLNTGAVRIDLIENGQYQSTSIIEQLTLGWHLV